MKVKSAAIPARAMRRIPRRGHTATSAGAVAGAGRGEAGREGEKVVEAMGGIAPCLEVGPVTK